MNGPWESVIQTMPSAPEIPEGRIVVLSAHPDDEVLAIGGWLADHADRELLFVTATDGEASHPQSPTTSAEDLGARRPGELVDALSTLGVATPRVERLRLPDGRLADQPAELTAVLQPWLEEAALVLAPFERDGHPDHDALGTAALQGSGTVPVWRFPIWTWAWARPDRQDWMSSTHRLSGSPAARERKRAAVAAFVSQVQPLSDHPDDAAVVSGALLKHALEAPEVVVL